MIRNMIRPAKKSRPTAPPVATTPPHTAGELRAIVSRYIAAYNARDVQSILSLYDPKLASFAMKDYDVTAARGFIDLFGLPMKVRGVRQKTKR